jgi:hypothetical protein
MELELDEDLFPARRSLIGLQFADAHDFERAQMLTSDDPSLYAEQYPVWSMIVVRREDAARFKQLGIRFREIEQIEDEDMLPEAVARRDRALIDSWKPMLFGPVQQGR